MGNSIEAPKRGIIPYPPITPQPAGKDGEVLANPAPLMTLELQDGSAYQGYAFGAHKSISGELVFQTGMVAIYLRGLQHSVLNQQFPRNGGISGINHRSVLSRADTRHNISSRRELWLVFPFFISRVYH